MTGIIMAISINKSYSLLDTKILALKNVSLEINEKDFTVISGPSGSG